MAAPWRLGREVYKVKANLGAVEQDPVSKSQGWGGERTQLKMEKWILFFFFEENIQRAKELKKVD